MKWCLEAVADSDKVWQVTIASVPFVIGRADVGKEIPGSPVIFVNSSKFELYEMDSLLASMQRHLPAWQA